MSSTDQPHIAVVLSGCGVNDGTEITEAVSVLVHLSRLGAKVSCFAPDAPQASVINHATGQPAAGASRNMMVESARISRGVITSLAKLRAADFDAVIFPGGYGAAKNLSDFATKGADCTVLPDVERVLKDFHAAKKPIGLCCVAPAIAARVLGTRRDGPGCTITLGDGKGTADAVGSMGSQHAARSVTDVCIDEKNRLITSPAYMYDAKPHEVFEGIGRMSEEVVRRVGAPAAAR